MLNTLCFDPELPPRTDMNVYTTCEVPSKCTPSINTAIHQEPVVTQQTSKDSATALSSTDAEESGNMSSGFLSSIIGGVIFVLVVLSNDTRTKTLL